MISVGAIIVSRLDSHRLPGKVLRPIGGRPLLDYVLQRCKRIPELANKIVLATSDRVIDDPIAAFARASNIGLYRGSTNDVATRLLSCALEQRFDYFLRVNGDSPFLEPTLVRQGIELLGQDAYDLVTNLFPRSFPYGVSVELIRTAMYQKARSLMNKPEYQEHITTYIYENIQQYRYANIVCPTGDLSGERMTIDTVDDFAWFEKTASQLGDAIDKVSYNDVLTLKQTEGK